MSEKRVRVRPSRCKTLVIGNTTYRSVYDFEVTSQDLDKARRVLNEKEEEREDSIRILKEKLRKDSEFRYHIDDHYLLCFLRFRKFDIDKAYSTIRKAYSMRKRHSELFILPPNLEKLYNLGMLYWLPYRNEDGTMIYWINYGKWKVEEVSIDDFVRLLTAWVDLSTMNPSCQIHGIAAIYDFKGFGITANLVTTFLNPKYLRILLSIAQDCFPERIKFVLIVNCNVIVQKVLNAAKFLMKKKIADRIKVLADENEIYQYCNPEILPKTLGGELEDDECNFTGHMMDNLPFLMYLRSIDNNTS